MGDHTITATKWQLVGCNGEGPISTRLWNYISWGHEAFVDSHFTRPIGDCCSLHCPHCSSCKSILQLLSVCILWWGFSNRESILMDRFLAYSRSSSPVFCRRYELPKHSKWMREESWCVMTCCTTALFYDPACTINILQIYWGSMLSGAGLKHNFLILFGTVLWEFWLGNMPLSETW